MSEIKGEQRREKLCEKKGEAGNTVNFPLRTISSRSANSCKNGYPVKSFFTLARFFCTPLKKNISTEFQNAAVSRVRVILCSNMYTTFFSFLLFFCPPTLAPPYFVF